MPNVDTGPSESNHKGNAKDPCKHTQMRAETVEEQTANRYIENLIINWASDVFDIVVRGSLKAVVKSKPQSGLGLKGARFLFTITEGTKGHNNAVGFQWLSRDIHQAYPRRYSDWLTCHLFC